LRQELHDLEAACAGMANGLQGFIGKLSGYAGRFALILHMIADPERSGCYAVSAATVENVRRLILDFIVPHAMVFYRMAEGDAEGDRIRTLPSWILTSGKVRIVASDLVKNVRWLRGLSLFDLNKRVSPLVAGGWLEPAEFGPACRAWTVNPAVWNLFEGRKRQEGDRKDRLKQIMAKAFAFRGRVR
jgi:hypothetical protein